ncbi:hypothetical protein EJW24_07945 [Klebsiella pneumoniae]|nr:hypothetical protein EJW24_07945 [Klebsiella pneumoniae]
MGSCAAPSAKGDDKFITTDYLQQCPKSYFGSAQAGLLAPASERRARGIECFSFIIIFFPRYVC